MHLEAEQDIWEYGCHVKFDYSSEREYVQNVPSDGKIKSSETDLNECEIRLKGKKVIFVNCINLPFPEEIHVLVTF